MNKKLSQFEVLSPAGNRESFFAAVNGGANAVYLGIRDFNARNNIQNFSLDELKEIIDYAHLMGVKVYLALNILIKNDEMEEVLKTLKSAYMMGIDALIVQDLGLAMLAKKCFPDLSLHASTQMGIHNLEGAKFLEQIGFKRVVLSRETPLEEIKRIHEGTNLEIEYFVQGALCVTFSGNCYLCSLITGNSGNRGKCQQFCRLPYKLKGENIEKEGYLLSAKDFCMLPCLKDLADRGVTSFKIEGRARRSAYVAGTTAIYRKVIDNNFKFDNKDIECLKLLFNRGDYTKGYFEDNKIIYPNIQGHKGVKIGKVEKFVSGKKFNILEIISTKEIHKGDGLKFIKNGKEIGSIGVQDIKFSNGKYLITTTSKIEKSADVYLTLDREFEEKLIEKQKKLKINGKFEAKPNQKAKLTLTYGEYIIAVESENVFEEARTQGISVGDIKLQLSKLGDEPFEFEDIEVDVKNIFARKAEINQLRRNGIERLKEEILKPFKKQRICCDFEKNEEKNIKYNDKKIYIIKELNAIEKIKDFKNILLVYSPNNYTSIEVSKFAEFAKTQHIAGFLDLPIFATEKDLIFIKNLLKNTDLGIVANNYYSINLLPPEKIILGMGLNIFNNYIIDFYSKLGFKNIVLSRELKSYELDGFTTNQSIFAFSCGRDEYMTLKSCPFKEHIGGSCRDCYYFDGLTYTMQNGKKILIERKKLTSCQFVLKSKEVKNLGSFENLGEYVEVL